MTYVEMDGHRWPLCTPIAEGGFVQAHESVSPHGEPAVPAPGLKRLHR